MTTAPAARWSVRKRMTKARPNRDCERSKWNERRDAGMHFLPVPRPCEIQHFQL